MLGAVAGDEPAVAVDRRPALWICAATRVTSSAISAEGKDEMVRPFENTTQGGQCHRVSKLRVLCFSPVSETQSA